MANKTSVADQPRTIISEASERAGRDLLAIQRKLSQLRIAPDGVPQWHAELLGRYSPLPPVIGPFAMQQDFDARNSVVLDTWGISAELAKGGSVDIESGFSTPYDALRRMVDIAEAWDAIKPYERVYFIGVEMKVGMLVKVGFSRDPEARLRALQTAHPERLQIFATTEGGKQLEAKYHSRWKNRRRSGEWFVIGDCIINEIERLKEVA